jgi:hypothetical protein
VDDATWRTTDDPSKMFKWLRELGHATPTKSGRRKLRLLACACCRHLWHHLPSAACRRAVEINERYADGLARKAKLVAAREVVSSEIRELRGGYLLASPEEQKRRIMSFRLSDVVARALDDDAWRAAVQASGWGVDTAAMLASEGRAEGPAWAQVLAHHKRAHCDLLREVFGNPFRPPTLQSAWLTWNDRTIPRLARAIYDERAFDRLGILADALEDAGCSDPAILAHCREPAEHTRGCWLVDLLLQQG